MIEVWGIPWSEIVSLYLDKDADVTAQIRILDRMPLSEYEFAYCDRDQVLTDDVSASGAQKD